MVQNQILWMGINGMMVESPNAIEPSSDTEGIFLSFTMETSVAKGLFKRHSKMLLPYFHAGIAINLQGICMLEAENSFDEG